MRDIGCASRLWGMAGLLLFLVWPVARMAQGVELSIVIPDSNPLYTNPQGSGLVDRVAVLLFERLGWQVKFSHLPPQRALINANEGIDDGDLFRVADPIISEKFPNLVKVDEPWLEMAFSAFTRQPEMVITNWNDLSAYSIGLITGWRFFEENTRDHPNRIKVKNKDLLFALLVHDRVQVILYDELQGEHHLRQQGLTGIRAIRPPLAVKNLHLYLHKKHAGLAGQVVDTLRGMKSDRSYQEVIDAARKDLFR
ncbi:MAG: transporter substrate-binding domain-containing protein [Magnetococcales bacterium]|nr:transporter substrate-binding domain-containing protein [Magnetococcales bacterium]